MRLSAALCPPRAQLIFRFERNFSGIDPQQQVAGPGQQGSHRHLIRIKIHAPDRPEACDFRCEAGSRRNLDQPFITFIERRTGQQKRAEFMDAQLKNGGQRGSRFVAEAA